MFIALLASVFIPFGLDAGDEYHLAFVTAEITAATESDIAYYDSFVQAAADKSDLTAGVTWHAIASTSDVDARDNAFVEAPVYRVDGVLIATGFDDIWDGSLLAPISVDQFGDASGNAFDDSVWTGSDWDGTELSDDIGLGTGEDGIIGQTVDHQEWMAGGVREWYLEYRMYGLSEMLTVDGFDIWQQNKFTDRAGGDLNGDGFVDGSDFNLLISGGMASPIPEPSALALLMLFLALCAIVLLQRGR